MHEPTSKRHKSDGGTRRRRRRGERGLAIAMAGAVILPLMVFAAFGVDLASWYARISALQRAADASALAGAVWMPNLDQGPHRGRRQPAHQRLRQRPGRHQHACRAGSTPTSVRVTITDGDVDRYFSSIFSDRRRRLTRFAEAEYNLPLPLGSPLNYFGGDATPDRAPDAGTTVLGGLAVGLPDPVPRAPYVQRRDVLGPGPWVAGAAHLRRTTPAATAAQPGHRVRLDGWSAVNGTGRRTSTADYFLPGPPPTAPCTGSVGLTKAPAAVLAVDGGSPPILPPTTGPTSAPMPALHVDEPLDGGPRCRSFATTTCPVIGPAASGTASRAGSPRPAPTSAAEGAPRRPSQAMAALAPAAPATSCAAGRRRSSTYDAADAAEPDRLDAEPGLLGRRRGPTDQRLPG